MRTSGRVVRLHGDYYLTDSDDVLAALRDPALGCSAAGSSSTAGGSGAALLLLVVDVGAALLAAAVDELEVELWVADEEPQPASATAMSGASTRA